MGILNLFKKKKPSLIEDIEKGYNWISSALASSGYSIDFSIESLKEIDRFFDENVENGIPKPNGLLSESKGTRIFGIGSYIGEVIRREYGGEWIVDDNDPNGEINISVKLNNGAVIWPIQRAMKRFSNGNEDGIYAYGRTVVEN